MGDKRPLDAIGAGRVAVARFPQGPDTVRPPALPDHALLLVNWSRTSRKFAGSALWFAALPFSLVNVAGYTVSHADGKVTGVGARSLAVIVHAVGVVVSISGLFWALVIAESILEFAVTDDPGTVDFWVTFGVTIAFIAGIVVRAIYLRRQPTTQSTAPALWVSAIHVAAAVTFGAIVLWAVPSTWRVNAPLGLGFLVSTFVPPREDGYTFCARVRTYPDAFVTVLNPVSAFITGSLLLVGFVTIVLALVAWPRGSATPRRLRISGTATALGFSIGLMHALGGSLRLAIVWILIYLDQFAIPGIQRRSYYNGMASRLLGFDPACYSYGRDWFPNVFAGLAVLGGIVFGLSFVFVNLFGATGAGRWGRRKPANVLRYFHRLVASLPHRLSPALVLGWVVWIAIFILADYFGYRHSRIAGALIVVVAHAGGFAVVLLLFFNGKLRKIAATAADIIGFWPVHWHPLGGRSYRPRVTAGLRDELRRHERRPVVLVGHSQGSVIVAWLLRDLPGPRPAPIHLVTCGSPIHSLYETFFPGYIDTGFYRAVGENSASWTNFWRTTDPIGTPLDRPGIVLDIRLADPPKHQRSLNSANPRRPRRRPEGHSNYWTDPVQMAEIAKLLPREQHDEKRSP